MKAIFLSDLHAHHYKQFANEFQRVENIMNVINYVFKFAHYNKIENIFFCGDLFDQFSNLSVIANNYLIPTFKMNFEKYPYMAWTTISGNHDFATKNTFAKPGISAQEVLAELFPPYFIIDNGSMVYDLKDHKVNFAVIGVPYYENIQDFYMSVTKSLAETTAKDLYLLMHQTVWPENPMVPNDIEPNDLIFNSFTRIFNGHIHHPSVVTDKFINVGAPIQRDLSDVGINKGFWIFDFETPEVAPIFWDMTDKYPQFIRKPFGEAVTEWESKQYIFWYQPEVKKKTTTKFDSSKFISNLSAIELITNYCDEVIPGDVDKLTIGLKLVKI